MEQLERHRIAPCRVEVEQQDRQRLAQRHPEQRRRPEHVAAAEVLAESADRDEGALPQLDRPPQQRGGALHRHEPALDDPQQPGLAGPGHEQAGLGQVVRGAGVVAGEGVDAQGAGQRTGVGEQEPAVDGQRPAGAHPAGDGAQPRDGLGGLRRREQRRGPRQQHRRPAPGPRGRSPVSPVSRRRDLRERVAVDVDLAAADLLEEPGDGGRVGGRDAVAAQLHRPERAEVAVALVGQRVVQRRGAVVDLGVQLRRGVPTRCRASRARRGSRSGRAGRRARRRGRRRAARRCAGTRRPARPRRGRGSTGPTARRRRGGGRARPRPAPAPPGCPGAGPRRPRGTAGARGRSGTPHDRRDRRRGARGSPHQTVPRQAHPGHPVGERHDVRGRARVGRPTSRGPRRAAPGRRRGAPCRSRRLPRGGRSAVRARRGSRR